MYKKARDHRPVHYIKTGRKVCQKKRREIKKTNIKIGLRKNKNFREIRKCEEQRNRHNNRRSKVPYRMDYAI
jgi:hypothetical protein